MSCWSIQVLIHVNITNNHPDPYFRKRRDYLWGYPQYTTQKCTHFRKNGHDHVLQWAPSCNINKHSNHVCCVDWRRTLAWHPTGAAPTVAATTSGKEREGRLHRKEDRRWPGLGSNSAKQRRGRAVVEFYITWPLWNVVLINEASCFV